MTRELPPLKLSAFPYLPELAQVVLAAVPVLPVPEASVTVVPVPSSNAYAATGAGPEAGGGVVAAAMLLYAPRLAAASVARTR